MENIIINDLEKCVGCNRCVRVCPVDEANITWEKDGKIAVKVDNSKCIACGACLNACHHGSRHYKDDTERFLNDIKRGEKISLIVAPALKTNFEDWGRLFTWLRSMGVEKIYDVSLGADICTWAHIRHIQKNGPSPLITQPCPVIVNYILIHRNELVKYLSPVQSPMLCTAIYMKKYENINSKIAAISPCVAKKQEFEATGYVNYNVTIKNLLKYIETNHIILPEKASGFDHYESGLGSLYPMPGGLKENIEYYLGKSLRIDKSEGQNTVYKVLDEYAKQTISKLPDLFDVLNCSEGCNLGTGCKTDKNIFEINATMDKTRQENIREDKMEYLNELFERFDKSLQPRDFIRRYHPTPVKPIYVTPMKINEAFNLLDKQDEVSKHFNCGACGNDTCYEMAEKIAKGINVPSNCVEKAHKDILREHTDSINFQKANLENYDMILNDATHTKELVENTMSDIEEITEAFSTYKDMATNVEKIAAQIKIISINALIEAAKAGQYGRTFGVIAKEIKSLAQSTGDSAKETKESSEKAMNAIESVNEMMLKIDENVHTSYDNISTISENTQKVLKFKK